jgi:general secretion pathway protein E
MLDGTRPQPLSRWTPDSFAAALGAALIEQGRLDAKSLERAERLSHENGARLAEVLTQLGLISERALAEVMSGLLGVAIATAEEYPSDAVLPERLGGKFLRKSRILPLARDERAITVAMVDPLDRFGVEAIALASGLQVDVRIAVPIDLDAALDRLYAEHDGGTVDAADVADATVSTDDDDERLKDLASEAPLIRLVNQLISQAVETHASDIHIDAFKDRMRIRHRYDGVLHEVEAPPRRLQAAVVSRIKIMAMLDIAERRLPQDGRIKLVVRGHEIDLRVSTVPSLHGESVVLRILDRSAVNLDFGALGMREAFRERLCDLLGLPNGIVLVTGPTGSGKTTTLYTSLLHLNSVERNIITVEDPIEYELPGITQIQVKPQIGLDFAALLRAILRHDPDIIMVGEIRDPETAQIAVQAALTGHLVLSTLHTNSSAATIARLRDMGMEDYLLTATLNGVMAQRLVRRLCAECKRPSVSSAVLAERFQLARLGAGADTVLFEPAGCKACRGTGYVGRVAVCELLIPDDACRQLILSNADHGAIQEAACRAGMRTMYDDGLLHAIAGITSISEVMRSVRSED